MPNSLTINESVRLFEIAYGLVLSWDRVSWLKPSATVELREPIEMSYDHKIKLTLRLVSREKELFILFEELSPINKEAVRQLFPDHPLLVTVH